MTFKITHNTLIQGTFPIDEIGVFPGITASVVKIDEFFEEVTITLGFDEMPIDEMLSLVYEVGALVESFGLLNKVCKNAV